MHGKILAMIMKLHTPILIAVLSAAFVPLSGQDLSFERFKDNPIIRADMLSELEGDNINGPTLIKVPDWIGRKLGKYYMYFAHHKGKYIRLAYADDIKGPWKIYQPGTLKLEDCICRNAPVGPGESVRHKGAENADDNVQHIASPDILIDDERKQIVMYYHCPLEHNGKRAQYSLRATSGDGLTFRSDDTVLGEAYFRVFQYKGAYYAIGRSSSFYRSADGRSAFEKGPNPFNKIQNPSMIRHTAVKVVGNTLWVFYSRVGDEPERIMLSKIDLTGDWNTWTPTSPVTIAEPKELYEGADLPIEKSKSGLYYGKVRQLRDPYVFEENNVWYLLYTTAGENAIGIGKLGTRQ